MLKRRPVPAEWATWAPLEGDRQLIKRFQATSTTVTRWRRETGLYRTVGPSNKPKPLPADFAAKAVRMHRAALERHYEASGTTIDRWLRETGITPPHGTPGFQPQVVVTMPHIWRDTSLAGQCAEFLRKKDPIFRCDKDGNQTQRGEFWFWLQRPRTDDFIIETASRKGFDPRAWERLAA